MMQMTLDELCSILAKENCLLLFMKRSNGYLDLLPVLKSVMGMFFLGLEFEDEIGGRQLDIMGIIAWLRLITTLMHQNQFVNVV